VPIPDGLIGNSTARLWVTWTRIALCSVAGTWKARKKKKIIVSRRHQSAACQTATRRR